MGPALLLESMLFYFCRPIRHASLLVLLLVSAPMDDKNYFKII